MCTLIRDGSSHIKLDYGLPPYLPLKIYLYKSIDIFSLCSCVDYI